MQGLADHFGFGRWLQLPDDMTRGTELSFEEYWVDAVTVCPLQDC